MKERLLQEILFARQRVYSLGEPTPLQELDWNGPCQVFVKREDLSPINAYKWRGSYNRMAVLTPEELEKGVVTASAGNHAQGVALAARKLGTTATIFMPLSTPQMKQHAVRKHGGKHVDIRLEGDSYDAASERAHLLAKETGKTYIHAYDDLYVMAGQGTLADEIVMSGKGPWDAVFLQIGGGGMAAGVATWLKEFYPEIKVYGVEGVDQASMQAAFQEGTPTTLKYVDVFCDGTAVRRVGELTYPLCHELMDEMVTVTNNEVSAAIKVLWETLRVIPEPSGAMGLAAIMQKGEELRGKRVLSILCGANMDFSQLARIASSAGVGMNHERYFRFHIKEKPGELLGLLENGLKDFNIADFQYGKTHDTESWPILGVSGNQKDLDGLPQVFEEQGIYYEDVTGGEDVTFRMIPFRSDLFGYPYFIKLEFPERPGALLAFLESVRTQVNICYFNYRYTGERVGRALIGFEFDSLEDRQAFVDGMKTGHWTYRAFQEISEEDLQRILPR